MILKNNQTVRYKMHEPEQQCIKNNERSFTKNIYLCWHSSVTNYWH